MGKFRIQSDYSPKGDQPKAIKQLVDGLKKHQQQTLLGVTGSGKTFTVANVIEKTQLPTLVISHNKTLAAQLYEELRNFFPDNQVCYFVSYYDYYQPESYLPQSDTYIEKDSMINEKIEQLRLETAASLLTRKDVIVVSSVSCIYGYGKPESYENQSVTVKTGESIKRDEIIKKLIDIQFERNDIELLPGRLRAKGDTVEVFPAAGGRIIRLEYFGDELEKISEVEPVSGKTLSQLKQYHFFPAKPYVVDPNLVNQAVLSITEELEQRVKELGTVEAYRLNQRTNYDLEMIQQLSYCKGMENYSRHFDGRKPGEPPFTLIDFFDYSFGKNWLMAIDESHQTLPQIRGMYNGDYSRKSTLIDYGFRLPSAFDNRPLKFAEFKKHQHKVIYVSATPDQYELENSGQVVEQIIRPTGLVDPIITVRPANNQVTDLIEEIKKTVSQGYRVLVTTLTKRLAEDLSAYFAAQDLKTVYLHSEIDTLKRIEIIKSLRLGKYDVLVGINLLREGLDIPEVALVAILDADKEGFLRNKTSLIQTIGRAARNVDSHVIMYAAAETKSIKEAISETLRRRKIQLAYNKKHGITPQSIIKNIAKEEVVIEPGEKGQELKLDELVLDFEGQMAAAAESLDFEKAIELRDKISNLKSQIEKLHLDN